MDQHRGVSLFLHGFGKTLVQEGVIVRMRCDRVRRVLNSGYGGKADDVRFNGYPRHSCEEQFWRRIENSFLH